MPVPTMAILRPMHGCIRARSVAGSSARGHTRRMGAQAGLRPIVAALRTHVCFFAPLSRSHLASALARLTHADFLAPLSLVQAARRLSAGLAGVVAAGAGGEDVG